MSIQTTDRWKNYVPALIGLGFGVLVISYPALAIFIVAGTAFTLSFVYAAVVHQVHKAQDRASASGTFQQSHTGPNAHTGPSAHHRDNGGSSGPQPGRSQNEEYAEFTEVGDPNFENISIYIKKKTSRYF